MSTPQERPGRLWSNRDFMVVWLGQGISDVGSAITQTAVPLLVVATTGSGLQMGLVGVLQSLPAALFALFAGAVADRWDRRWIMFWVDLARAVLLASVVAVPALFGVSSLSVLYAVTVPLSLLYPLFFAAYAASIPSLVPREQLPAANAALLGSTAVSYILGPAVAAVGIAYLGAETLLGVDAATFALAALSLLFVRRPLHAGTRDTSAGVLALVRNGIRFIRASALLRSLTVFRSIASVLQTLLVPVAAFFVTMDHALAEGTFGFIVSAWAAGSLAGSVLSPRLARARGGAGAAMLVAQALGGAAILGTAGATHLGVFLAGVFAVGVCGAIVTNLSVTLRQRATPDELLGRVTIASDALYDAILPAGMLLAGAMMETAGGTMTLGMLGGLMVANAAVFAGSAALRRAGRAEAAQGKDG